MSRKLLQNPEQPSRFLTPSQQRKTQLEHSSRGDPPLPHKHRREIATDSLVFPIHSLATEVDSLKLRLPSIFTDETVSREWTGPFVFLPHRRKSESMNNKPRLVRKLASSIMEAVHVRTTKQQQQKPTPINNKSRIIKKSSIAVLQKLNPLELEGSHVKCQLYSNPKKKNTLILYKDSPQGPLARKLKGEESSLILKPSTTNNNSSPKKSNLYTKRQSAKEQEKLQIPVFQFDLFIECIRRANKIANVKTSLPRYKFYIGEGNNSYLVRAVLRKRFWWTIVNNKKEADLVWTQNKSKDFMERIPAENPQKSIDSVFEEQGEEYPDNSELRNHTQQTQETSIINNLECTAEVKSTKKVPFPNSRSGFEKSEELLLNVAGSSHLDYCALVQKVVSLNNLDPSLSEALWPLKKDAEASSKMLINIIKALRKPEHIELNLQTPKMHNHLECHWELSNKKALFTNMKVRSTYLFHFTINLVS